MRWLLQIAQAKSPILICTLHTAYIADKVKVAVKVEVKVKVVGWVISSNYLVVKKYGDHFTFLLFDRKPGSCTV